MPPFRCYICGEDCEDEHTQFYMNDKTIRWYCPKHLDEEPPMSEYHLATSNIEDEEEPEYAYL